MLAIAQTMESLPTVNPRTEAATDATGSAGGVHVASAANGPAAVAQPPAAGASLEPVEDGITKEYGLLPGFTDAMHLYATVQGKGAMTDPSNRGSKWRRMLCTGPQGKRLACGAAVPKKCDGDVAKKPAYLSKAPPSPVADKYAVCRFVVVVSKSKRASRSAPVSWPQ